MKSYAVELNEEEETSLKARLGVRSDGKLRQKIERIVKDFITMSLHFEPKE